MKYKQQKLSQKICGDWSSCGIEQQIQQLKVFQHRNAPAGSRVNIDCSKIEHIDYYGLQLLYVWLHLLEDQGLHCSLINIPEQVLKEQELKVLKNYF